MIREQQCHCLSLLTNHKVMYNLKSGPDQSSQHHLIDEARRSVESIAPEWTEDLT